MSMKKPLVKSDVVKVSLQSAIRLDTGEPESKGIH